MQCPVWQGHLNSHKRGNFSSGSRISQSMPICGEFIQLTLAPLWIAMPTDDLEGLSTCTAVATKLKILLVLRRKISHHPKASVSVPTLFLGVSTRLGEADRYLLSKTTKNSLRKAPSGLFLSSLPELHEELKQWSSAVPYAIDNKFYGSKYFSP